MISKVNNPQCSVETVRKIRENFQYFDMGIFVHILSSSE